MPNLHNIGSWVQKMAKQSSYHWKYDILEKWKKKFNFSFGILAPWKHFQINYTKIWLTLWIGTPHLSNLSKFEQKFFQKLRILGPENHLRPSPSIKISMKMVFPIKIQFIKLWKLCEFMRTGLWTWSLHIVHHYLNGIISSNTSNALKII